MSLMVYVSVHIALVVVTVLKGKVWLGLFGIFVSGLALIGAARLAKPRSPWARRFYGERRRRRAEVRYEKHEERWAARRKRALDLIGGAPSEAEAEAE